MHPTILQQLAQAHVADLHCEAEQCRAARTARQAHAQAHQNTPSRSKPAILARIHSLLTSRIPATQISQAADMTPDPIPELTLTAASRPS